ncbi:SGNH family hydrolase [Utexia brackfieldae]|uniref:SGNH/GDSL hydrolase family protein n=1 Tax=Utexia brackfieldae TaxID=3074108 RepID=UPI00370D37DD
MSIWRIFYVLLVTLCGLLFLYQQSIEIYWQQTYHTASPFVFVGNRAQQTGHEGQTTGEKITQSLTDSLNQNEALFSRWNQQLIHVMNDRLGLVDADDDNTVTQAPEIVAPHQVMAPPHQHQKTLKQTRQINHDNTSVAIHSQAAVPSDATLQPITPSTASAASANIAEKTPVLHPGDKLFFVGDSLMQGVAPRVKRRLYNHYKIESIDLSKQSTGLSYPKAFDWPKVIEETLALQPNIKVMAVFLGPNDPWNFPIPNRKDYLKFKSTEWEQVYRSRIERILQAAAKHQVAVIWLGAPCMRATKLHQDMLYLNQLYRSEVEKFAGQYIPTSELLGCSDAQYVNFVATARGNIKARIDDGIHFTVAGQRILASKIMAELTIAPSQQEAKNE